MICQHPFWTAGTKPGQYVSSNCSGFTQTYDSHPTWYTLEYTLSVSKSSIVSFSSVSHWELLLTFQGPEAHEREACFFPNCSKWWRETQLHWGLFYCSFSWGPASFLCPRYKDLRYELLNGWKDLFSLFVQAIHNICQQRIERILVWACIPLTGCLHARKCIEL